jgi:esterase/lipase superfamily enzyme
VDDESWYASWRHPAEQARWQGRYERYVLDEVLPLSQQLNSNPYLIAAGASFGAYHALAMSCRHPSLFNRAIGMSGIYDIRIQTGGYSDEEVYLQNPCEFVANEHDPWRLAAMQRQDIILATGRDDGHRQNNDDFSGILWRQGIGNALRLWDGWCHDWPWWHQMIRQYIGGHD